MPFSSLFNRKGSRKNQSKDKSGQIIKNDNSEDRSTEEGRKREGCTGKSEFSHADRESNVEEKTCEVSESTHVQSEASTSQDIQTKHAVDQKLTYDNCSEVTDVKKDVVGPKEDEMQMKKESANDLSLENVKLCGDGSSHHGTELVDEEDSCSDVNGQKLQNSIPTHNDSINRSQNDGVNEENQLRDRSGIADQYECDELVVNDKGKGPKDTDENANEGIIADRDQEMQHLEDNGTILDNGVELLSVKNEGKEVDICIQGTALNTSHTRNSPTAELSNEEVVACAETNESHEPQTSELLPNVLTSSESTKEFSSAVADIHEPKFDGVVINCSDCVNSVPPTETAPESEQLKNDVSGNTEDEMVEKITSVDAGSAKETLPENNSISDFSASKENEHVASDSQRTTDQKQCVATESEKIQSGLRCADREGEFEEVGSSDEKVILSRKNTELEFENVPGDTEDEMDGKINSVDIGSPEERLPENNSICEFSASKENEHVVSDSPRTSEQNQCVATESDEVQNDFCCTNREGNFEETNFESSDEKVMPSSKNAEREFVNVSEKMNQDLSIKNGENSELPIQGRSSDMSETLEETDSTDKSLNYANTEHAIDKLQDNEVISTQPLNDTSISSAVSHVSFTDEESKTPTLMDVTNNDRRDSTEAGGTETKHLNDGDANSGAEIPENNSSLTEDEKNYISSSQVPEIQSTSPIEDSLDSFPSGCEDFLGGQRTLLAAEQHPSLSWKVGYLQVKLPVKSRGRGRGKLKVWRQRWVVIQMDEFVKDTKNPSLIINIYASECGNARIHSALFWCTVSASKTVVYRSQSRTHKYAFSISVDNDVVLHLAAESETASQEWMTAIRNLLWPPSPVLQLEKVLHGSDFEVSIIDNEFSFHAGLLGTYGNMKITSNKLILSHPQTDHVIQEWYLNTLDKFQLLPQNKEEDSFKVVVMHTGQDSSTGSGQIILFCPEAVTMLQSIASTIHKFLQYKTTSGKDHNQQELASLAEWISPPMSPSSTTEPPEDYYKTPRRQIRSLLDIPNFSFEKPLSNEGFSPSHETVATTKPTMLTSATSASTFSEDSGISMAIHPDEFLNCSVTSFTIGGRPVRDHTSSDSSDGYSPPGTPEIERKIGETEET